MSAPRRGAASPERQFEKCAAGAPTRSGADSPPAFKNTAMFNRLDTGLRMTRAAAGIESTPAAGAFFRA
jgi:hypothetical protein